ncbi:hypothetical protein HDV00_009709 [Rhizophlyctis rosea]|nr:hypothetical protein HDV00_009709 [Rhizophlyctis rosea]
MARREERQKHEKALAKKDEQIASLTKELHALRRKTASIIDILPPELLLAIAHAARSTPASSSEFSYILQIPFVDQKLREELLAAAAERGDSDLLTILIQSGIDVHADEELPLKAATCDGHLQTVKLLVEAGADIHVAHDLPLDNAIFHDQINIAQYLLSVGADVRASDQQRGGSIVRLAVDNGNREMVQLLLEAGADVDAGDGEAIYTACEGGHFDMVKLMIAHGADLNAVRDGPLQPAAGGGNADIVKFLWDLGVRTEAVGAMIRAVREGHGDVVKFLLGVGETYYSWRERVYYDHKSELGKIFVAGGSWQKVIRSGNAELVSMMIDAGQGDLEQGCADAFRYYKDDVVDVFRGVGVEVPWWAERGDDFDYWESP